VTGFMFIDGVLVWMAVASIIIIGTLVTVARFACDKMVRMVDECPEETCVKCGRRGKLNDGVCTDCIGTDRIELKACGDCGDFYDPRDNNGKCTCRKTVKVAIAIEVKDNA
jgi:hypothetical protein